MDVVKMAAIGLTGLLLHFSMKWFEYRRTVDGTAGAFRFIRATPAQSLISAVSTLGAFLVIYEMDWMNPGMAFACGYMGNSIAENLATKFGKGQ